MADKVYKYRLDRRTFYFTVFYFIIFILFGITLSFLYEGGYFSAWFCTFVIALIALMSLSIPCKIIVNEKRVQIRCILDIKNIELKDIISVEAIDKPKTRWFIPIFAGFGFFGYYGHYLDLKKFEFITIYASEWGNFVAITDVYGDRYYISIFERADFIQNLQSKLASIEDTVAI